MHAPLLLASVVETLAGLAEPWKSFYDDSTVASIVVVFLHLAALLVGGGFALAADRATLRAAAGGRDDRDRQLAHLALVHRSVVAALGLAFVTGALLFLADVETYAVSVVYWVKMGLVALLLLNGYLMKRHEDVLRRVGTSGTGGGDDAAAWGRLRLGAVLSGVLWLATLLLGVTLTNAA